MTNARELSNRLVDLLRNERHALAEFILALSDFDRERRWVELGHRSLFAFLQRDLALSNGAAFYRMTAARLVQRHPEVVEPLRDGRLCLTNVVELAKVVTAENIAEVLPRFFHLSKNEAKEVAAELNPTAAPTRTVVTAIPAVQAASGAERRSESPTPPQLMPVSWLDEVTRANADPSTHEGAARRSDVPATAAIASTQAPATVVAPKTAELSRIHVTVSRRLLSKLAAARDALSHSHPSASDSDVIEAALDLLLERDAKRKGLVKTPRATTAPQGRGRNEGGLSSRYIPAAIRRAVWKRGGGRCQWPLEGGGVCGSTVRVQLHHKIPWAKGGSATVEDLMCACDFHNDLAARQDFGDAVMDRYSGKRRRTSSGG
jgi:hypothetical protein